MSVLKEMFITEIEVENDAGDRWWDFQEKLSQLLGQYPELEAKLSPSTKQRWEEGTVDCVAVLGEIYKGVFSEREPDDHLPGQGN